MNRTGVVAAVAMAGGAAFVVHATRVQAISARQQYRAVGIGLLCFGASCFVPSVFNLPLWLFLIGAVVIYRDSRRRSQAARNPSVS